jgi:hypothetical protein
MSCAMKDLYISRPMGNTNDILLSRKSRHIWKKSCWHLISPENRGFKKTIAGSGLFVP